MDRGRHNNNNYQLPNNEDVPPFFEPILEYYNALPIITRTWFTVSLIVTGLHTLEVFETNKLILLWDRIPPPHLELWRIVTSFAWAGPGTLIDFPVLMLLYSMVVVLPGYENDPHDASWIESERQRQARLRQAEDAPSNSEEMRDRIVNTWIRRRPKHRQSDCIFALIVCTVLILLSYLLVMETSLVVHILPYVDLGHPILLPVFTRTLLYSIITLHSLKHPNQQHNINFFPVPGRYVPLFHVGFGVLMGYRINETIHGIAVGFLYALLVQEDGFLASLLGRTRVIHTPHVLIHLVGEEGIEVDVVSSGGANANVPYPGVTLEGGANFLHHAAAIGDASFIQSQVDRVESATSPAAMLAAAAPFQKQDRNGWQPLHEAARAGQMNILVLLLEVDRVENDPSRTWRRRTGKLKINVNARTNNDRGFTALRLVEENHGQENECAALLRELGGVNLGFGDDPEGDE